jgi:hypothetical protein
MHVAPRVKVPHWSGCSDALRLCLWRHAPVSLDAPRLVSESLAETTADSDSSAATLLQSRAELIPRGTTCPARHLPYVARVRRWTLFERAASNPSLQAHYLLAKGRSLDCPVLIELQTSYTLGPSFPLTLLLVSTQQHITHHNNSTTYHSPPLHTHTHPHSHSHPRPPALPTSALRKSSGFPARNSRAGPSVPQSDLAHARTDASHPSASL